MAPSVVLQVLVALSGIAWLVLATVVLTEVADPSLAPGVNASEIGVMVGEVTVTVEDMVRAVRGYMEPVGLSNLSSASVDVNLTAMGIPISTRFTSPDALTGSQVGLISVSTILVLAGVGMLICRPRTKRVVAKKRGGRVRLPDDDDL